MNKLLNYKISLNVYKSRYIEAKRNEINLNYKGLYCNKFLILYIVYKKLCISYIKLAPHNRIPFVGQAAACWQISDVPWLIRNIEAYKHLKMPTLKKEIIAYAMQYKVRLGTTLTSKSSSSLYRTASLDWSDAEHWNLAVSNKPLYQHRLYGNYNWP